MMEKAPTGFAFPDPGESARHRRRVRNRGNRNGYGRSGYKPGRPGKGFAAKQAWRALITPPQPQRSHNHPNRWLLDFFLGTREDPRKFYP